MTINIKTFFDPDTATFTHVVTDPSTQKCAIIDSVLDYDQYSGRTKTKSADQVISYITEEKLSVEWILDTHIHADHITPSHRAQIAEERSLKPRPTQAKLAVTATRTSARSGTRSGARAAGTESSIALNVRGVQSTTPRIATPNKQRRTAAPKCDKTLTPSPQPHG